MPLVLTNIEGMEEVLGDRCISIILEKSNNPAKTKLIEDFELNPNINRIKRTFEQFSVVSVVSLSPGRYITAWNSYIYTLYINNINNTNNNNNIENNDIKERILMDELFLKIHNLGINGRNFELLFPMVLLSHYLSSELLEETLRFGKEIMEAKQEIEFAESRDVSLYDFVSNLEGNDMFSIKELTNHFKLWLGESSDEWINERWFGRALKRLNLIIDTKRLASGRFVTLNKDKATKQLSIFKKDKND